MLFIYKYLELFLWIVLLVNAQIVQHISFLTTTSNIRFPYPRELFSSLCLEKFFKYKPVEKLFHPYHILRVQKLNRKFCTFQINQTIFKNEEW